MQDCSKYDMMISASLDGELDRADAQALEKHLAICEDCRNYLRLLETVKNGLHEELPDPPETLREGIMYKVGLEKHRKLRFGAYGRWTVVAAVLCLVIFGVVKLNGSGVMKTSAPEAAAPAYSYSSDGMTGAAANGAPAEEAHELLTSSKSAVPAPSLTAQLEDADHGEEEPVTASGGSEPDANDAMPAPGASGGAVPEEPGFDSVYNAASLQGYDTARAALDEGDYWGVCLFYGALPEGQSTRTWQTKIPSDGELARWQLSVGEMKELETGAEWKEFYYGDLSAGQGLVIVIAGEEE